DGRFLALVGEPGVGKTRLAQEVMLQARATGWVVLVGRCYEEHDHTPYFPFRDVLAAAWEAASPVLRERAGQRFAALGRLLPDLLPTPPREDGEEARLQVLHAVGGFLGALADEHPVLVLLDDLHWADHAGLDILRHLVRSVSGQRILVLGAYRDVAADRQHPLVGIVTQLQREQRLEVLPIGPLTSEGTAALIGARFDLDVVSAEQRSAIHARTEGNPFFAVEVAAALAEQGVISQAGDDRAPDQKPLPLPQSIHAVVEQRVSRLGPAALETLRLASVLGQEFDLEVLLAAVEGSEETVLAHMEAALAARLLEERQIGQTERYAFTHALIAQALYEDAPRFRLRRLHLRVAGALERLQGAEPEGAAEIGRHFLAGGDK
ncbi:MAG TPA: AAA family ATPase, partial [Chloroflexota bacterium]|nr:AAA family ATPase [Chloroflexota bacterium]